MILAFERIVGKDSDEDLAVGLLRVLQTANMV